MNYLDRLDKSQLEAALAPPTPLLVRAGAGAGKSTLMACRVAHQIDTGVVEPSQVFLTAFTRAAANEMQEKIDSIIHSPDLVVGTFHSLMFNWMNNYRDMTGLPRLDVLKAGVQKVLVQNLLGKKSKEYPEALNVDCDFAEILGFIGAWKNRLWLPDCEQIKETIDDAPYTSSISIAARAYPLYEDRLKAMNMLDFDDMLIKSYYMLLNDPRALANARGRWKCFMNDETQDSNDAQWGIFRLLAPPDENPNITAVGDLRQAIYTFRGGRPELMEAFAKEYKAKTVYLQNNYRSFHTIVDHANQLMAKGTEKAQKSIKGDGGFAEIFEFSDGRDQALAIVSDIQIEKKNGRQGGDIAILVRTNAQSADIEAALIRANIPYWSNGGSFYDRMEIADILAYLRLANFRDDIDALDRLINKPTRYLGKAFVSAVWAEATATGQDLVQSLRTTKSYGGKSLSVRQREAACDLADLMDLLQETEEEKIYPVTAITNMLGWVDYMEWLRKHLGLVEDADSSRQENVDALKASASQFNSVVDFLNFVSMAATLQKEDDDAVRLLTIHRAKGGEWPVVWLPNMFETGLPHHMALKEGDEIGERRVAYVAVTRAMEHLRIGVPMYDAKGKYVSPSRFLEQMGLELPISGFDELHDSLDKVS